MKATANIFHKAYGTLKTKAAKAAGKLNGYKDVQEMYFYKEFGTWYADVQGWTGPQAMTAMVAGADVFLDYLSGYTDGVRLSLSLEEQPEMGVLHYVHPHPANDGAFYVTELEGAPHMLWLCGVTEFVFGHMPPKIWFEVQ